MNTKANLRNAVSKLNKIAKDLGSPIARTGRRFRQIISDLKLEQAAGCLRRLYLVLLDGQGRTLNTLEYSPGGDPANKPAMLFDRYGSVGNFHQTAIKSVALHARVKSSGAVDTSRFKCRWSPVRFEQPAGRPAPSPHASSRKNRGNTATAPVQLQKLIGKRLEMEVTKSGARGFAFARLIHEPRVNEIFSHFSEVEDGEPLHVGDRLIATLFNDPVKGLQAKQIRRLTG